MGQKVHPGGTARRRHPRLEVELVRRHEGVPDYLLEDVKIREHIYGKLGTRAVRHPHPRTSSGSRSTSTRRAPGS